MSQSDNEDDNHRSITAGGSGGPYLPAVSDKGFQPLKLERQGGHISAAGGFTVNSCPTQPRENKKKKSVFKLLEGESTDDACDLADPLRRLQLAITAIFLKQQDECDVERLYQAVTDLCDHNMGGVLYKWIQKECEAHVSSALRSLDGQTEDHVVFLSLVHQTWQVFGDQMLLVRRVASYLDQTYVKATSSLQSLWEMALELFLKHFKLASQVKYKTVSGLLKMTESVRSGQVVDRALLNRVLKMLTACGIYYESFEKPFLESSSKLYAAEGVRHMESLDVPDYLKHVEVRLQEEHSRYLLYLEASTIKSLVATAERELLQPHISAILDKGFEMLVSCNRTPDLRRMYTLFSRVNALEPLRLALSSYIRKTGLEIVKDEEEDKDMVPLLIEFKFGFDKIWEECFLKNDVFYNTIKDSFVFLINLRQNRAAELISKYLDEKLCAGSKSTSEKELEATFDKVLDLFRFIQGKDLFEAFYRKDLAKRLLLGESASIDAEKLMISKLKTECGSHFTENLKEMCKDVELSKEINESFKLSSQARTELPSGIEMSVNVLKASAWPTYPQMDVRLPLELDVCQGTFKEFYKSRNKNRRLMWQNSLGHCVLKAEFANEKKELVVSLFQAVVLMLFNDAQKLRFEDVKDNTKIEDKELRRTLQSLACGKVRVLQKIPEGRDVNDNDCFMFNDGFTDPRHRIKVSAIRSKEIVENVARTAKRVFEDRRYQIDAAITRIMKMRRTLDHKHLMEELFQQLNFPIEVIDFKRRIEDLITREFLERDKSDPQIYRYIA